MGRVIFYMTVSVDGFVAGPNDEVARLFRWYFSGDTAIPIPGSPTLMVSKASAEVLLDPGRTGGAMITGRRNFEIARGWGGDPPTAPCFVLTHRPPDDWVEPGWPFVFVHDGIESAVRQAREAAGDKDVEIGTPSTLQQALGAGLVDEIHIDQVPLLLGQGIRLFDHLSIEPIDLEVIRVVDAPGVTHLRYRVVR
jgi:dihydrofolate reductase